MIAILSAVSVLLGLSLAVSAEWHPRFVARLETAGGVCLIGGLAMIGGSLSPFG